jgi:vacuolar-type H+-ATPase subunit H
MKQKLYELMDSFLVEAGERSVKQLNQDRHLFIEKLTQEIEKERQQLIKEIKEKIDQERWEARHSKEQSLNNLLENLK